MNEIFFKIEENSANARIDKYISENAENMTRSAVQKLIAEGCVTVNGKIPDKNLKIKTGDCPKTFRLTSFMKIMTCLL